MASSTNPPRPEHVRVRQAQALAEFAGENRLKFLQKVADRRKARLRDRTGFDRVPIRLVDSEARPQRPDRLSDKVPVVADELVVTADLNLDVPGLDLVPDAVKCCNDHRVYRVAPDASVDIVALWHRHRVAGVQLNGVATLGDTVKGPDDPRPAAPLAGYPGGGPVDGTSPFVVVIDTGLDVDAHNAGWLGRPDVRPEDDSIDIDPVDAFVAETQQPGTDDVIDPCAGHGTFVAGVIRRVAPSARVRTLRAVDSEGFTSHTMVAAAICRAAEIFEQEGERGVINLSLGGETTDDEVPPIVACALATLPDDIVVVAAAGNEPTRVPVFPGWAPGVEAVAALGHNGQPAIWSNRGDEVDFTAPGEGIVSMYVEGTDGTGDEYDPDPYALWTGTSFATPQVAALIARRLADNPNTPASDLVDQLRDPQPDPDWGTIIPQIRLFG